MTIGLGIGALLAIWLPDYYFHMRILSMLIAGMVGVASGIPSSFMAVLDGLLSGVMAGMMGTMFMAMVPITYTESALKVLAVLCSSILFVLLLMLQSEVKQEYLKTKSFLLSSPGSMFAVILLFVYLIH